MADGISAEESSAHRRVLALFTVTIFLAAALLFLVQPMIAKMVLPRLGGSPEVWNTAMVFFQLALLLGYGYAHVSVRLLGAPRQAAVHAIVLLLPLLVLPIALPEWEPPTAGMESAWLVGLLLAAVGAPFIALATASPLLQRWFAGTGHPDAHDPYFLYAGSNAGSLLGLLAYPFVLEPFLSLAEQSRWWALGYVVFVALAAACALTAVRAARGGSAARAGAPAEVDVGPAPSLRDRLFWIACASVPSCLLIGATHYLTTDVAPIPLLWVVPLSVYLITFILAFARRPVASAAALSRGMAVAAVALALALLADLRDPVWALLLVHIGVLTVVGLLCHTRLAAARPAPGRLTEFYVFVAIGGVVGGAFAALAGPRLFNDLIEYPIAIVLACLLRIDDSQDAGWRARALDVALPAGLGLLVLAAWIGTGRAAIAEGPFLILTAVLPPLACYFFSPRRLRFALGVAVLFAFSYSTRADRGEFLYADRTFFGVHRVSRDPLGRYTVLRHGSTIHGVQSTDPAAAASPLGYYHADGPGGQVVRGLAARKPEARVAFVGLGAGALAVLTGPRQHLTIYEIDAAVVEIAEDARLFSYLAHSPASYDVVVADGRIALADTDARYDLIVLDAFSSDAIPVHLLTREAVALYMERLVPGGALLFHVSNQHLELAPVLGAVAGDLGLVALDRVDPGRIERDEPVFGSHWVLLGRDPADFAGLADSSWRFLRPAPGDIVWTDDFSNVLSAFRRR